MQWRTNPYRWRRRFALLPIRVDDTWAWLEFYWARDYGEYIDTRLQQEMPSD